MPFIPNTPESLIQRSDSRDPAATCRGLTSTGRPCRRPTAGSPRSSKSPSPTRASNAAAASNYCWQHKDQAPSEAGHNAAPQGLQKSTIRERTSIDTLVDRLGLLEVESPTTKANTARRRTHSATPAIQLPKPEPQNTRISEKPSQRPRPKPTSEPGTKWDLFCCFGLADEEPAARPTNNTGPKRTSVAVPNRPTVRYSKSDNGGLSPKLPGRPGIGRDPPSKTAEFLSLIPPEVSPETSAILLAELAKPMSALDEPGYIYIFWLTDETLASAPPPDTTRSLLAPPLDPSRPQAGRRRTSDVLQSFSTTPTTSRSANSKSSASDKKPILLKIGRANNVQRRMNEWQRQCGYMVSLIRYYPYVETSSPSSPPSSPSPKHRSRTSSETSSPQRPSISSANTPRKVPNAHKVERLIHLELSGRGKRADMGGKCVRCGKEHREWFQIEGSRAGLREVDEVIRRWVGWGERGGI